MKDYLVRTITDDGHIRCLTCISTNLVREGTLRHGTLPTASTALGRGLTAGVLMGALLKTGQRVALKFEGNGPLGKVIVEAESNGAVRGYVGNPAVNTVKSDGTPDVVGAIGTAGLLTVTKDLKVRDLYTSTVLLYTSEIGEDLAYYLTESEQVPSAVGLGVFLAPEGTIAAAGGFLVQVLPGADDGYLDRIVETIRNLPPLGRFLIEGGTPEALAEEIFGDIGYKILEKRELGYVCSCSREKIDRILLSLGGDDLRDLVEQEGGASVTCEFCRQVYEYDAPAIEELRKQALA